MTPEITPIAYRVKDAAKLLGLDINTRSGKETIYKLIHSGQLVARKTGDGKNSRFLVTRESIDRFLNSEG